MTDLEATGDLHLGTVVINVQDMAWAVEFWAAVLGSIVITIVNWAIDVTVLKEDA